MLFQPGSEDDILVREGREGSICCCSKGSKTTTERRWHCWHAKAGCRYTTYTREGGIKEASKTRIGTIPLERPLVPFLCWICRSLSGAAGAGRCKLSTDAASKSEVAVAAGTEVGRVKC